jgi:hypothetical protein
MRILIVTAAAIFIGFIGPASMPPALAQDSGLKQDECVNDNTLPEGLPLRSLKVKARWGWVPPIVPTSSAEPILTVGEPYTAHKRNNTIRAVSRALLKDHQPFDETIVGASASSGTSGAGSKPLGVFAVLYTTSCTRIIEGKECNGPNRCVDVEIRPYYVRLERTRIANLILPIPRSNRPTFLKEVPRTLMAFNPGLAINYDREYGPAPRVESSIDLLTLKPLLAGDEVGTTQNNQLLLQFWGDKSLKRSFYDSGATLSLQHTRPGKTLERIAVKGQFVASNQPSGNGKHYYNSGRVGATFEVRPGLAWLGRIVAGGSYRFTGNRFFSGDGLLSEETDESAFDGRAIIDGRVADGLVRLGVWGNYSSPNDRSSNYRRGAAVLGYQKELPVALNQTVGLELVVGAGRAVGDVPEYARFYGGNLLSSFLYDDPNEPSLSLFPSGPLLRSFGKGQAGGVVGGSLIRGATSYRHLNVNVTIPIPKLSRPLIPAEKVIEDDELGIGGTLKDVIKGQMNTAQSSISVALQEQGSSFEEAEKEAEKIVREVRPAVNFIADQANIVSLKPLFMFDAAKLSVPGSTSDKTRFSAGGGLQLTIVVAKFEGGYMRTMNRLPADPKGNFVFRLVFQNLF